MSFATVMPYACIVDGPRAVRWWADVKGRAPGGVESLANKVNGDGGSVASAVTSLALNMVISGILLFLHSAVGHTTKSEPARKRIALFVVLGKTEGVVHLRSCAQTMSPAGPSLFVVESVLRVTHELPLIPSH